MNREKPTGLAQHFAALDDPRQRQNREYKFIDILVITICAAICGADDWVAVEQFGCAKQAWFESFLELPSGIPTHDTFWRVFRYLDAEQFQACFIEWIASVQELTAGEVVAVPRLPVWTKPVANCSCRRSPQESKELAAR